MDPHLQARPPADETFAEVVRRSEQEERRRISRLLHDDLQQLLYAVQLKLALVDRLGLEDDELRQRLRAALELLARAISRTRQLTVDLSPSVMLGEGLSDALGRLRTQMSDLHALEVELHVDSPAPVRQVELAGHLVQVVRDVLLNISYTGSTRARVEVTTTASALTISISGDARTSSTAVSSTDSSTRDWAGFLAVRARLRRHGADAVLVAPSGENPRLVITAPRLPNARRVSNGEG